MKYKIGNQNHTCCCPLPSQDPVSWQVSWVTPSLLSLAKAPTVKHFWFSFWFWNSLSLPIRIFAKLDLPAPVGPIITNLGQGNLKKFTIIYKSFFLVSSLLILVWYNILHTAKHVNTIKHLVFMSSCPAATMEKVFGGISTQVEVV